MQKRVVAVHDISCVGKCSLTVALPILSAAGIETSILPTAILSTHTGGFEGYTFHDLTNEIMPIAEHWKSLNLRVDAFYTGYLGSFEQLELVSKLFDMLRNNDTLIFIDPVMGDNGKLYAAFSQEFAFGMAKLCSKADIIVPNLTEASHMLGIPYVGHDYDKAYIEDLLVKLTDLGPKKAILSGISFEKGMLGAAAYDKETKEYCYYFREEVEGYYHGTGDVFASGALSALLNGKSLEEAIAAAVDFTHDAISRTYEAKTEARYGVDFENALPTLLEKVK